MFNGVEILHVQVALELMDLDQQHAYTLLRARRNKKQIQETKILLFGKSAKSTLKFNKIY